MASVYRGALEALFRSTGGEIWKEKANWTTGTELSTWHGVKVDEDGRVVELRLDWDNNLQGIIGSALRTHAALMMCFQAFQQVDRK